MGAQGRVVCSLIFLLRALAELAENSEFYLLGDYLLGGLFTLHANMKGIVHLNYLQVPKCKEGVSSVRLEVMVWAGWEPRLVLWPCGGQAKTNGSECVSSFIAKPPSWMHSTGSQGGPAHSVLLKSMATMS
ncbi:hypothetical protein J1605_000885 [Eschrichtius robustus]|uniref:Uncharacterized protein n=1 Tax=Eschrichtius robustus TaxID=9764 RepID=A0AB34GK16_ESCRO|nr:hypothetical protein J1605_000885 [Eschrichtius robustus]